MNSAWRWKAIPALLFTVLAVYFTIPNFVNVPTEKEESKKAPWYVRMLPSSALRLGLDLQGGIHMVLGIDLQRAIYAEADRYASDLKRLLPEEQIQIQDIIRDYDNSKITVHLSNASDSPKLEKFIKDKFNVLVVQESDASKGEFVFEIDDAKKKEIEQETVGQALETLRNRLDEFGVSEPSIQAKGLDQIVVQLPGLEDPERAKGVLGRTARLEFKLVDDESMDMPRLEMMVAEAKKALRKEFKPEELNRELRGKLPMGTQILMKEERDPSTNTVVETPFLLKSETVISGDMLEDARIGVGEFNQPTVNLTLDPIGTERMADVTNEKNIGKRLAIILDDKVQSAPVLNDRITNGRAQITFGRLGSRHQLLEEAKDLALVLRAGALPAPVEILQTQAVGPSLGRDSIENGFKAIMIGVCLILVFMALYYRLAGVAADIAVLVNLLFTIAALGALHGTLTLPGIAGILISIGMAVDANVIVNERIREELREGKSIKAALEAGYDKANITILDSNLTTIITGVVLLQYGTGSIRGFAVTLILGLIANYFTALWFTRIFFEWFVVRFKPTRLSV